MEQNSKVKIETYLVYLIFIIFFGVVGYKIHENNKAKDVVQSSRQEIKDIKDSTLNIADQFIEDVKKDKAEKDSTILVLTKEKKKINEKIIKISTENTKKDSEVNQYKEKYIQTIKKRMPRLTNLEKRLQNLKMTITKKTLK